MTYPDNNPTPDWTNNLSERRALDRSNVLLTTIAVLIGLSFLAGIILGWIAYDRIVDRLDNIETYTETTSENTVTS